MKVFTFIFRVSLEDCFWLSFINAQWNKKILLRVVQFGIWFLPHILKSIDTKLYRTQVLYGILYNLVKAEIHDFQSVEATSKLNGKRTGPYVVCFGYVYMHATKSLFKVL